MKLTLKKLFISILGIAFSIAAAVIGMYMLSLADMVFGYRLLFSAIFMFNPILIGFMMFYMFRKPEEKPAANDTEKKRKDRDKEREETDTPEDTAVVFAQPSFIPPAEAEAAELPREEPEEPQEPSFDQGSSPAGYDLPGSETYTNYSDTMNASDISDAESSKSRVKKKLKFWEKSSQDNEGI